MSILNKCVVGEFRESDRKEIRAFYERCREERRPAVWLEKRDSLVDVNWDLACLPPSYDRWYRAEIERVFSERLEGAFRVTAGASSEYRIGFFDGDISGLSLEAARRVTEYVYELLSPEVKRARRRDRLVKGRRDLVSWCSRPCQMSRNNYDELGLALLERLTSKQSADDGNAAHPWKLGGLKTVIFLQ